MNRHARRLTCLLAPALIAASFAGTASAQGVSGPYLAAEHASRLNDIHNAARYFSETIAKDPNNPDLLERGVLYQLASGRLGRARTLARTLKALEPDHDLAILVLAADALREGNADEAVGLMAREGSEEVGFAGRLLIAWARFGAGEREAGMRVLDQMEKDGIGGPAGKVLSAYHLGLMRAAVGDDAGAAEAFAKATETAGRPSARLARFHAGALARLGRNDEALSVLEDRLSTMMGDSGIERMLGAIRADEAAPEPAVTTAAEGAAEALYGLAGFLSGQTPIVSVAYGRLAVWMDPDLAEARLLVAETLSEAEQYALAEEAYAEIPSGAPQAMEAMIGRAAAMEASERLEDAVELLREVRHRFPEAIEAHTALGDTLRRDERWSEAAEAYTGAIDLADGEQSRFWPLYYQRGISWERADEWEKAEPDFQKALTLSPDQPFVLNYLGYSWVEMGRNLDEAEAMIEKAVQQRPDDGYIVDSLGWVQFRLGEFDAAVQNLERAVELRPVDPVLNDHLGDALWMVGRKKEARVQWNRALSFEPEEEDVAERIRRKLAVGLDEVLAAEAAEGKPTIITRDEKRVTNDDG